MTFEIGDRVIWANHKHGVVTATYGDHAVVVRFDGEPLAFGMPIDNLRHELSPLEKLAEAAE